MKRRNFLEGDDTMKAEIFSSNKTYRLPINDKVEAWIKNEWKQWEVDKPEWFTDNWKAKVPKEMNSHNRREVEGDGEIKINKQVTVGILKQVSVGIFRQNKNKYKISPGGGKEGWSPGRGCARVGTGHEKWEI